MRFATVVFPDPVPPEIPIIILTIPVQTIYSAATHYAAKILVLIPYYSLGSPLVATTE